MGVPLFVYGIRLRGGWRKHHGIRLVVAVSFCLFCEGIYKILEPEKDIKIISEASTHIGIIPLVEQKKPDVLFIDTAIPNLDIVKILGLIREKKGAETKVLLLLHTPDEEVIINSLSLGVRGCLTDTSSSEEFIQAIRAISKGEIWADIKIITKVLTRLLPPRERKSDIKPNLTKREEEVVRLVVQGLSNEQISNRLFISEKTVKNHLGNIFNKLGISSRLNLAISRLGENIPKPSPRTKVPENPEDS
jgi:DNA-binding NarL/FixJ family response regulator